jgi:hypothetical protein
MNTIEGFKTANCDADANRFAIFFNERGEFTRPTPLNAIDTVVTQELEAVEGRIVLLQEDAPLSGASLDRRRDHIRESGWNEGALCLIRRIQGGVRSLGENVQDIPFDMSVPEQAFGVIRTIFVIAEGAIERRTTALRMDAPDHLTPLSHQLDYLREAAVAQGEAEALDCISATVDQLQQLYG